MGATADESENLLGILKCDTEVMLFKDQRF